MTVTTFSSREFNHNTSGAKKAARKGPVFITDRGRPAFALLKIDDYYRITGQDGPTLLQLMEGIPGGEGIAFDPEPLAVGLRGAGLDDMAAR